MMKKTLATVALTGAIGAFAFLNSNSLPSGSNFLSTPMTEAEMEFITFISQNQKSYGTKEEYEYRLGLFTEAYNKVKEHNADNTSYKLGINQLADMNDYEYKKLLGYKTSTRQNKGETTFKILHDETTLPASVDWRSSCVTGVKN
jgi:hypothetical protein